MFCAKITSRNTGSVKVVIAALPAHDAYLQRHCDKILAAGPTVRGDGRPTGSLYIFEAATLLAAVQFVEENPMTMSGALDSIEIVE